MTDRERFAPLVFFEYDHKPGHYCLMLSDNHMLATEAVFAEFGYEGGGYGWAGVARSAVATQETELGERVNFDPEAGMFVAYGEDAEALRALGALLREAVADPATLRRLIAAGDPEWFD
ncbi:Imm51 family immunity protein [Nocardia niigatensis]|uniref:Imm51 family immunity protein n=1 Tax=Nocardia niigatensis TaxID=209249 RepID=UPI0002DECBB7|nr:Imm51 family immunity protein [Nocardia niigatensis]